MNDDGITIDADTTGMFAALDAFVADARRALKEDVSRVTAENVAREARARVARRTGATAATIRVEESIDKTGYVVIAGGASRYLERGTERMRAKPFFDASARLEEGRHVQRTADALQDAAQKAGLGE